MYNAQDYKLSILGIHNPIKNTYEDQIKNVFASDDVDVILGDFNAHWNEHRATKKSTWIYSLRNKFNSYIDIVTDTMVTFKLAKTTIDHIFIKKDIYKQVIFNGVIETKISDHNLLLFSLDRFN